VIAVERLSKDFGRTRAVRDVSFRVERGQVIGLLGPNGSGKTTIMRILTGFFPPTSGSAWVAGLDVSNASLASRERVGYLPENAVFYPEMRVRHFLEFCADVRRLRLPRRRARLDSVVETCGLGTVRNRLIGNLSKGFRQRVGLAQALLHEPAVLILDEPTVGLDPSQIIGIRNLIRSLRGETTVLLSTHILSEAATICDRVVILDRGRLVAEDSADALSRGLQSNEQTFLRVDGPAAVVFETLRALPGIERVEPAESLPGEASSFILHSSLGDLARANVASAVVAQGWGLIEMRPVAVSLEELFLHYVGQEMPGPTS
jgi:gliding motility-associated transport system ATP-binding protein